jgi:hypothetical protein
MGTAVGPDVDAGDVDDPDHLDVRRQQVACGTDNVRDRQRLLPQEHPNVDLPVQAHRIVAGILNALLEVCGHIGQVEVRSCTAVSRGRPACRLVAADAVLAAVGWGQRMP